MAKVSKLSINLKACHGRTCESNNVPPYGKIVIALYS